ASNYAGQSSAAAANARAAAAAAHRQAAEADRAAGQAESLANQAASAAADARDAANAAAVHAHKAAAAANDAADHAGEAAQAAARSTAHAQAATEAADTASAAAAQAQTVYTLARKIEAEDLLARTNAGIAQARDLKAETETAEAQRAQQAQAAEDARRTADELAQQAQQGTSDEEIAGLGRQLALSDMKYGKSWLRAAAQTALGADTQGVVAYVRTGRAEAQQEDDRTSVGRLAEESSVKAVRDAAEQALDGDGATVGAFLHQGQYDVGTEAFRVAIAQAADSGSTVVRERARAALNAGTTDGYRTFLTTTLPEAQEQDDRVRATQLVDSGTPEVQAAARVALEGPASLLRQFVESGQYTAQRKDLLALTHDQQVQQLVAEAQQVAAKAQMDAATANATAAKARAAASEAQDWADKAQHQSDLANTYSAQADQHARDAEASAQQASASAKTARDAANRAEASARQAAVSASDATLSSELAQNSAGMAWASAAQAKASAERADKSSDEALAAATEAFVVTVQKYREEDEARRRQAVAAKEASERNGSTPAELYRCGLLGCEALENPGRWCQHNEVFCDVLSKTPELEVMVDTLLDLEVMMTGLPVDSIEGCLAKHDLMSCWDLGEQFTISTKMRLAGIMYRGLRAAMTGCGQCFLPGTRVVTGNGGDKPIERVHTGDLVRATDPVTGETGAHRVTRQIVSKGDKHLTAITIRGPTGHRGKVTATADHPFWSISLRTWVAAGDLRTGDTLRTDSGAEATVTAVRSYDRWAVTYSLTVAGLHSFYVLAGRTPVLVHNSECKVLVLALSKHMDEEMPYIKGGYNLMDDSLKEEIGRLPKGQPYTKWMQGVNDAMSRNQKIAVSMKGWDPPTATYQEKFDAFVKAGQGDTWGATEWEMGRLEYYYRTEKLDWDNVTFWNGGEQIEILPPLRPGEKR
ncbi:chemotaxis protein, partial [Streptomyces sp. SID4985]|uniref:polymorphic toxin-type HINT domain-containing protein n=3 Tax=unclassified Streptomyces TaxID=2593676 RepID=UPI00136EF7B6